MPNIGFQEIILIMAIALITFGPKKLPEIGKAVGQGLREFKKVSNDLMSSFESIGDDEPEEPRKAEAPKEDPEDYEEAAASKEGEA